MWFKKQKKSKRVASLAEGQEGYAFRRSRTLTGSSSQKVTAAASQQSQLKTDRLKLHELRQLHLRAVRLLGIVALGIVALAFIIASYIGEAPIRTTQTQSGHIRPPISDYQKTIAEYFGQHPFERFSFLLNTAQLENFMRAKHIELLGVGTKKTWYGGKTSFSVRFRQPLLLWQVRDQRFYVDDRGVAFTYNYFADPTTTITDQSGVNPDVNGAIASKRFIRFLGKLVAAVNAEGVGKVSAVVIPAAAREVDIRLEGRDYPIKTHIDRDPLQQADDIKNTLRYFDAHHIVAQYVDVRVASRAFYKNK